MSLRQDRTRFWEFLERTRCPKEVRLKICLNKEEQGKKNIISKTSRPSSLRRREPVPSAMTPRRQGKVSKPLQKSNLYHLQLLSWMISRKKNREHLNTEVKKQHLNCWRSQSKSKSTWEVINHLRDPREIQTHHMTSILLAHLRESSWWRRPWEEGAHCCLLGKTMYKSRSRRRRNLKHLCLTREKCNLRQLIKRVKVKRWHLSVKMIEV